MDDRKWTFKVVFRKLIFGGIGVFFGLTIYGFYVYFQTQTIDDPKKCFTTSMNKVYICSSSPGYIHYKEMPKLFYRALTLSEDASFFSHEGFDWYEIKESFRRNIIEWRFARGGSTITQQLAKNMYLSREKSLDRKFKEFFISKQIEEKLSKGQILEKYINVVEFGRDIYGINKASFHYFGKHPSSLNVLESAYLVSLLPNPKSYGKSFEEQKLSRINIRRMKIILGRLYRTNRIDDETYVYCETLIDTYDWPFPYFNDLDIGVEDNISVNEELSEELEDLSEEDQRESEETTEFNSEEPQQPDEITEPEDE